MGYKLFKSPINEVFEPFDGTVRLSLFHFFDGFFGVTFAYNFCNALYQVSTTARG